MAGHTLSLLDAIIIGIYLCGVLAFGLLLRRRRHTGTGEFFLASHKASWLVIGPSLVAPSISPTALIGITGSAYAIGISVYNYEWMAAIVLAFFAIIFLPAIMHSRSYTMPEFLERRYDARARLWFAGLTLLLNMLLDGASALYGGGILLQLLMPQLDLTQAVSVLALLAGIFTVTGGLRATMYTEAIQTVIILLSALLLAYFSISHAGGWGAVVNTVDPRKLSLIRPVSDPYMPWTGLMFGVPILGFYFWCTNQFTVQRILAARSPQDGQRGALFAGFLKLLSLFLIVLPGSAAIVLYPHLVHGDQAYPQLLFDFMPPGLLGMVLAAFAGALMAQLAAAFNSATTLITMDFIRRAKPGLNNTRLARWGRLATLGCTLATIAWAPQIAKFPSLWQYLQSVMAYATPPVVALFAIGMLWPKANARGGFAAIITGSLTGMILFIAAVTHLVTIQFLYVAAIVFVVSSAALVLGSLLAPMQTHATIAEPQDTGRETPRSRRPDPTEQAHTRLWAAALIVTTALIVFCFR